MRGERVPLWRTKVSQLKTRENGNLRDVLPKLIAVGANYFGHGLPAAVYLNAPKIESPVNPGLVASTVDSKKFAGINLVNTILKEEHATYSGNPGKNWDEKPYLISQPAAQVMPSELMSAFAPGAGPENVMAEVVVIAEQTLDPTFELVLLGVIIETIPENCFGLFGCEGMKAVAHLRGDEVDGVVAIPVFEAVLVTPPYRLGR